MAFKAEYTDRPLTEEEKIFAEEHHDMIRPEDFEQKIIDIFLYQMKQKCANDWVWKIIEKIILKRLDK